MKILITGGTGFVGHYVLEELAKKKIDFVVLTRSKERAQKKIPYPCEIYSWDPLSGPPPKEAFDGVTGVINLIGENIAEKRWSDEQKKVIYDSRIMATRNIAEGVKQYGQGPLDFLVSASAIGFYKRSEGDETLTESSQQGEGWLAQVCADWEEEARKVASKRTCTLRIGVVLGREGGALQKMLLPFKLGLGGPIGSGSQYMSWIHVQDLANLIVEACENQQYEGNVNAVAPEPVTNKVFTKALGRSLRRPTLFPVPPIMLKLLLGEMSCIVLDGQKIMPKRAGEIGFQFNYGSIQKALDHLCNVGQYDPVKKNSQLKSS